MRASVIGQHFSLNADQQGEGKGKERSGEVIFVGGKLNWQEQLSAS